ncbi:MAG: LysR substrate-binding domain-containing protein, partial [Ilumatobacteraceae bacterium]
MTDSADDVAVDEEPHLHRVAHDRGVGVEREVLGDQPRGELEDLGVGLERTGGHPHHREGDHHGADQQRQDHPGLQQDPPHATTRVARRLGTLGRQLCAAPSYLAARGIPEAPADLAAHDWLGGRPGGGGAEVLELTAHDGRRETVRVESRVAASQAAALHALCLAGWGISAGISEDDARALADGRLVPVLSGWQLPDRPVYAVMPRRGRQPAKVRHALSLLQAHFDRGLVNERITALASPGAASLAGRPNSPADSDRDARRGKQRCG